MVVISSDYFSPSFPSLFSFISSFVFFSSFGMLSLSDFLFSGVSTFCFSEISSGLSSFSLDFLYKTIIVILIIFVSLSSSLISVSTFSFLFASLFSGFSLFYIILLFPFSLLLF